MFQGTKFILFKKLFKFKLKNFSSWKIFLSSYAGLLLPIVCINLCLFTLLLLTPTNSCLSGINSMSRSRCRCCRILRPCLGGRICRWQCGRATWSYALTFRQFRQISYGSAEPLRRWQQCCWILLYFYQSPSVHAYFVCTTSICILGRSNCYVSGLSYNSNCLQGLYFFNALYLFLKQCCPDFNSWRPQILWHFDQFSWNIWILGIRLRRHHHNRASLLPKKRLFSLRRNSMERSSTTSVWNRCCSCRCIVFWNGDSLYESKLVYGSYCSYNGGYWVWSCFCGQWSVVLSFPMAWNSMERVCLK